MQQLERAVAVFCIACICAELTTQLAGSAWTRRCIKAVAGLYILVVFARALPQTKTERRAFALPQAEPASIGTMEGAILTQTRKQLEMALAQQWKAEAGTSADIVLDLTETDSTVFTTAAKMILPQNSTPQEKQQASRFLQRVLDLQVGQIEVVAAEEEAP